MCVSRLHFRQTSCISPCMNIFSDYLPSKIHIHLLIFKSIGLNYWISHFRPFLVSQSNEKITNSSKMTRNIRKITIILCNNPIPWSLITFLSLKVKLSIANFIYLWILILSYSYGWNVHRGDGSCWWPHVSLLHAISTTSMALVVG